MCCLLAGSFLVLNLVKQYMAQEMNRPVAGYCRKCCLLMQVSRVLNLLEQQHTTQEVNR